MSVNETTMHDIVICCLHVMMDDKHFLLVITIL